MESRRVQHEIRVIISKKVSQSECQDHVRMLPVFLFWAGVYVLYELSRFNVKIQGRYNSSSS